MAKQATAAAGTQAVTTTTAPSGRASLMATFAAKYNVDPDKMNQALKATCFKTGKNEPEVSNEQLLALVLVSNQYGLNPFTKEIYAFPDQKGGIVPVVGVDGWIRIVNARPELVAIEFAYAHPTDDTSGPPAWIECRITRKDRDAPMVVREYLAECKRNTGPWQSHPARMLRHKAFIQCARLAFGYSGICDPDEADRIANAIDVTPTAAKPKTEAPRARTADANGEVQPTEATQSLADASLTPPDDEEAGARG